MAKKETEFLNEITKSINSVSTLTDIMTFVIYHLEERYGWMTTWLLTTDKENGKFTTFSYNPPRLDNDTIDYFKSLSIPITEESGIIYQVYKNQTHYYSKVSETYELSDLERKFIEKEKWNFLYYLPLVIYEEVVGILFLHRKDEFSIDERVQLERVSEQIAGAIQNAQLLRETEKAQEQAELERQKSEKLLLNILPKDVAEELKEKGFAEPILFESVSVLFTDFKGFTQIAESMTPKELVEELDSCFSYFDSLMERYNLEKLKTIGDSYMCAGGIPRKNKTHAIDCALAAMEIQSIMKQTKELKEMAGKPYWELRLGIHSGPLVAGVIGEKKFAYDVWGDTVNTASRMESSGTPGKINISGETYELIKDLFDCEYRGKVKAKNKGEVEMYYLNGLKLEYSKKGDGRIPGEKFWERYKGVTYKI
ncbi:MAG: GAF domain-containing protein [Leptospiraceae bacterium]|nr:GAF domain-containing protein [Leptospiraceae bacterium]